MSDIAKDANISVGNIYTYFKNKEDLFYSVVPARHVDFLRNYLVKAIHLYNKSNLSPEDEIFISEKFINVLIKYRMHLIIIFEKNKGTQYEKEKNELIQLLLEAKKPYLKSDHKYYNLCIEDNMKLMQIIISNSFNMILDLLKEEISDESRKTIFKAINVY
ncbi:MAG: TetR/AcrR family transcriptional regulator, partial [Proteocatella sp.]